MSVLSFQNISKSFAKKRTLDNFNLTLEQGEVYGLLGPNGCGKSTAINILANLLDPDSGTVTFNGLPHNRQSRRCLGICPQEIALYRDLDARENLSFFAQLFGLPRPRRLSRVTELLQLFHLEQFAGIPIHALSGGWQRRVNFAVALVHSPQLLVLDEPTSAVDMEARHELWHIIEQLRLQGCTILLTTHLLDEAEHLCSRIGIMKNGSILRQGTVLELLREVPALAIATIEGPEKHCLRARAVSLGWQMRSAAGKHICLMPQTQTLAQVVQLFSGLDLASVTVQPVSLEHAYLEVIDGWQAS